tara:strand:- start:979 stop:2820 length:1842 start_codon:yes stop_codon:yes gene_type:complete
MAFEYPKKIRSIIQSSASQRRSTSRVWDLCILYLEGKQHLDWDTSRKRFSISERYRSERVTVNRIIGIYRTVLARLDTAYPSVAVLPASNSWEDITRALASEQALHYYWSNAKIKYVIQDAIGWLLSTGNVALHTFYSQEENRIITNVVRPYDIFFEKNATSWDESDWVSIRSIVRRKDLKSAYPEHAEAIDAVSSAQNDELGVEVPEGRVELFETHWHNGKYAISVGETYLYKGTCPGNLTPIQFIRYTKIPNRIWGTGLVSGLIDLQNQYNRSRSQQMLNVRLMSNPVWLIPKTSGVSRIQNRVGENIYYNAAGGKPERVAAPPLPGYVGENVMQLHNEMMDVAGVHNTSLGKRAVGITSGKAIEALAAQDSSQLDSTMQDIERAVAEMAKVVLVLMKAYYTEPRMIRMMDNAGAVIHKELKGTSLVQTPEIHIEAGSLFRKEAQDRDMRIMDLLEAKLIEPEQAMKELSFRSANTFALDKMQSLSHAMDMLDAAKSGLRIEIFPEDDLSSFAEVFGQFIRSEAYYGMPPDRQNYIRDIYVSITTFGQPQEEYAMAQQQKVFPRQDKPSEVAETISLTESVDAREQIAGEDMDLQQMKSEAESIQGVRGPA